MTDKHDNIKAGNVFYMHTLEGRPAFFDGWQICLMTYYGKANPLAKSLKQIRTEQRISTKNRSEEGLGDFEMTLGHLCVEVPGDG